MSTAGILDIVKNHLLERYLPGEDPGQLTSTTPLISTGLLDSLSVLELVSFLEERFGIEFEAHEVERDRLDTLASIEQLVNEKVEARG